MSEPLDLRAVEARTWFASAQRLADAVRGDHDGICSGIGCEKCLMVAVEPYQELVQALLAHARALRAALREVHEANLTASNWLKFEYRDTPVAQRVAAVLAQATDEAGA